MSLFGGTATTNVASGGQVLTRLGTITTDLMAGTPDYVVASQVQAALANFQSAPLSVGGQLQGAVQQMLVDAAILDTPLTSPTVQAAMQLLAAKMIAASANISYGTLPAIGAQTNSIAATPVGNPTFMWSTKDAAGRNLVFVNVETITVSITQDAQNGATAGQEPYALSGEQANPSPFAFDWLATKYGSGASGSGQLVNPVVSNTGASTGNLTTNGAFVTFTTTNYADNWVYVVGVATTNFLNSTGTTTYYANGGSLQLLSAGGTKHDLRQSFNTTSTTGAGTGGTPFALVPSGINNAQYAVFIPYKLTNASPTNGTVTIDLIDGADTVIADDAGTNNTDTIDLTAIADTNWHVKTCVFRMPQTLPTSTPYKLRIRLTGTILDNGKGVYLGGVGCAIMTQFYVGGPYFQGFRGSTNPNASGVYPDTWTFGVTATIGKFVRSLWRWFDMPRLAGSNPGIYIPTTTSGAATISESLVA